MTDHQTLIDELARQRALSDATFEAIFLSEQGICLHQNRAAREMFGYTDAEAVGRMGTEWIAPEDRQQVLTNMLQGVESPYEVLAMRRDGTTFPCEIRGRMVDFQGRQMRVTVLRDISERKRAEGALLESERRNRALLAAVPDLIFVLTREGTFQDYHGSINSTIVVPPRGLIGSHISEVVDVEVATRTIDTMAQVLATGRARTMEYEEERDGVARYMEARAAPCGRDMVLFLVRDVTETVGLRKRENRAQRLETAGRIAGQVAHDFNNLLGPLVGLPTLIRETLPGDHPALRLVDSMEDAARQMAEINQQLLTLGRRGHYNQEIIDLGESVARVIDGLEGIPDRITIESDLAEGLLIKGGPAQVRRVIANLVGNAVDAIEGKGIVRMSTRDLYLDRERAGFFHIPMGEYAQLTVRDDGCGMSAEDLERAFEPFYSTKTVDRKRGSGLGLSVVKSVIEDHRGYLDIDSTPGKGTTIQVLFPLTRERPVDRDRTFRQGRGETVLVVDDDRLQREISAELLTRLGYRPSTVASGEDAVSFLSHHPQDLVLLDMIMPGGMDGADTLRRILKIAPEQRVIIVSGYAESDRVKEAQRLGAGEFVRKPLTLGALGRALQQALASR